MPARKSHRSTTSARHPLTELALHACLVASDAAFNIKDLLATSSQVAFLAVRDCEKELDRIEQQIDEQLPAAIAQVTEQQARELLACLRFSTDLERIGDLLWFVAQRMQDLGHKLPKPDSKQLVQMVELLEKMLQQVREGFSRRELDPASFVIRADHQIDEVHHALFRRHFGKDEAKTERSTDVLLMAQALERAGDHATNVAEELFRLIEGRSLRHTPKRQVRD